MENQAVLWKRIITAKRNVLDATQGTHPDLEFRSSQLFQAYTGLCGEAQFAYDDQELDEELVRTLEDYSARVISAWMEHTEKIKA